MVQVYKQQGVEDENLSNNEEIATLSELGLTQSQAKVYLATFKLSSGKAKEIWKESGVGRQEVYQILSELSEMGLIEKEIVTPTLFKATSLSKGLQILLERKHQEIFELSSKVQQLANRNTIFSAAKDQGNQFSIFPRKYFTVHRGGDAFQNAQETIDFCAEFRRFANNLSSNSKIYEEAIKKGVRLRGIIEKPDEHQYERLKNEATHLFSSPKFIIKFADPCDCKEIYIIDGKEAFFSLQPQKSVAEDQVLWTNNQSIIFLAQKYFEAGWNNASDLDKSHSAANT